VDDRIECQPDPASVRAARLFVVDRLQDWGLDDLVDSAALLTSEVATNAVLHTRRPFLVRAHHQGPCVRIEVIDQSEEVPNLPRHLARATSSTADTGDLLGQEDPVERLFSGLGMVDAVATRWGADPLPGEGKTVWFELQADEHRSGLRTLRYQHRDEPGPDLDGLPPLVTDGLDDVPSGLAVRIAVAVGLLALLAVVVYAGLWAGGVLGEVWYGH